MSVLPNRESMAVLTNGLVAAKPMVIHQPHCRHGLASVTDAVSCIDITGPRCKWQEIAGESRANSAVCVQKGGSAVAQDIPPRGTGAASPIGRAEGRHSAGKCWRPRH